MLVPQPLQHVRIALYRISLHGHRNTVYNGSGFKVETCDQAAKSGARSPGGPEQVLILCVICPDKFTLGGHKIYGDDLLTGIPPAAEIPSHPTLKKEPAKPDRRATACRKITAKLLQVGVEFLAALDRRSCRNDARC